MIKRPIYLFCAVCLAWSCTSDPITPEPGPAESPARKPVAVVLTLHMADFEAPPAGIARNIRATAPGPRNGLIDAEISPAGEAPATRAGGGEISAIPDDQKVFRLDILQFDGTGEKAQLIKKEVLSRDDGDLSKYVFQNLSFIESGTVKNRIVVLVNAPESLSAGMQVKTATAAGTNYGWLQQEKMSRSQDNAAVYPLVTQHAIDVPVSSGTTVTTIATGSQIGVDLTRTVAKVNFELLLSQAMIDAYSDWDIVMNAIPPASFYTPLAYEAPFPEVQITDTYFSRPMGVGLKSPTDPAAPLLETSCYLPVNLQHKVPGTTVAWRYLNSPTNATTLQILGKKIVNGSVTQTVLYMIPLGANFTDDYSIRPNNAINYRITLVSDSPDDSSVVKFIAGKFAGKFRSFTNPADNSPCWGFEEELEVWPEDVKYKYYPGDTAKEHPSDGTTNMCWMYYDQLFAEPSIMSTNDGLSNTQGFCKFVDGFRKDSWTLPTAAYMCYRQLNGLTEPLAAPQPNMWFLPAINQLAGIYVAGSSQVNTMQSRYWSSTLIKPSDYYLYDAYYLGRDGTLGVLRLDAPVIVDDPDVPTAAVRGCRIPPPGEFEPKMSR